MKTKLHFKRFFASLLLLVASTSSWAYDLAQGFGIWESAIDLVGLNSELARTRDTHWDEIYATGQYQDMSIYSGSQWSYYIVPKEKVIGHTLFVLSDATLSSKYGISSLQGLYDKARALYGGENLNVNDAGNADKFRQVTNPLYRLVAYHILKGRADYNRLTTICTIETSMTNPTEWYGTMDGGNLVKVEQITTESDITALGLDISPSQAIKKKQLFLNHSGEKNVRGAKVIRPDEDNIEDNEGNNNYVYEIDDLIDYTQETQSTTFNACMRMNLYTMFPELMTNRIRSDVTNEGQAMSNSKDALCKNYWFPEGYIDGLEVNSDAIFLYQGPHNTYWCYEGDEFNITSNAGNYDVTMEIPPLPVGTYQIRLGFANMPTRGICQFYYDGEPMGVPSDMRSDNFEKRTGWIDIWTGQSPYETPTSDTALAVLKNMHRRGWYHGPEDVFCISGEGHEDGDPTVTKHYFSRIARTCRYVLGNQPVEIKNDGKKHTIRIKSVYANTGTVIQLDYLEFVPESEWGDYDPSSSVYDFEKDGIYYINTSEFSWKTGKLTRSVTVTARPESAGKYSGNIIIPPTVTYEDEEYSVTSIEAYAFRECNDLTSVFIPESMENMDNFAFLDCPNLATVTINSNKFLNLDSRYYTLGVNKPALIFGTQVKEFILGDAVKSIGESVFLDCTGLTTIDIPDNITSIGARAFENCSSLTSITIPNNVTAIGTNAFSGCPNLKTVVLNNDAMVSAPNYFANIFGTQVEEYVIGENVKSIGEHAFSGCSRLASITIPERIKSIGSHAFSGCSSLASINVAAGNTKYDSRNNCNAIIETKSNTLITGCKNTIIPNSVTSIGSEAFYNCSDLTSITIPESVTSIGNSAFSGCSGLTSVNIPNSVTSIGVRAFAGCTSLPVEGDIRYADTYMVEAVDKNKSGYTIKDGVRFIGDEAFYNCSKLVDVNIPESVISVGNDVFYGCSSLPVENQIRYAGTYLVEALDKAKDFYQIKDGTRFIGSEAFYECGWMKCVVIPASVKRVGSYAFDKCFGLETVICHVTSSDISMATYPEPIKPEPGVDPNDIPATDYLYPFNPAHNTELDPPTTENCDETTNVTTDNLYTEDEVKVLWLNYYKKVYNTRTATTKRNNRWMVLSSNPYIKADETTCLTLTEYTNQWNQYAQDIEMYNEYSKHGTVPVPATEPEAFQYVPQADATLYVYSSVVGAYSVTPQWKEFGQILPIEDMPSAVNEIEAGAETVVDADAPIYDLNGRILTNKPISGYYIQSGKLYRVK